MTTEVKPKSLGAAIDEIIGALTGMEKNDQLVAINAVCKHIGLDIPVEQGVQGTPYTSPSGHFTPPPYSTPPNGPKERVDIRTLKEQKQPSSAREMACIVAYYLDNLAPADEVKTSISTNDVTKYFKQAGYPLPSAIDQLLKDAKTAGYLDSGERGSYKLNPVGYNLVVHALPRIGNSSKPRKTNTATKRKNSKNKKKALKK